MKVGEAMTLIRNPAFERSQIQSWCDLGCGFGTFTVALAQSLVPGSTIHAVDMDPTALEAIPNEVDGVAIRKVLTDVRSPGLRLPLVDSVLMAKSLHFIEFLSL